MKTIMRNRPLMRLAVCLISMAAMILQSCSESGIDRDKICGTWTSVEGRPDVLVYKEGECYKVTVFSHSGRTRRLKPAVSAAFGFSPTVMIRSPRGVYLNIQ